MPYWFKDEAPPETPELGGYSHGVVDKDNPAPEGTEELRNKTQLNRRIKDADDAFVKAVGDKEKQNNGNNGQGAAKSEKGA